MSNPIPSFEEVVDKSLLKLAVQLSVRINNTDEERELIWQEEKAKILAAYQADLDRRVVEELKQVYAKLGGLNYTASPIRQYVLGRIARLQPTQNKEECPSCHEVGWHNRSIKHEEER